MKRFHFVEFAARSQKGFRNHIVSAAELPRLTAEFGNAGCYASSFFYSDDILTYLDANPASPERPSVAGYKGKVWASVFILDLDHPDLSVALKAARYLAGFWLNRWHIGEEAFRIFFSGSKGFHLTLDTRSFGKVPPSAHLPVVFAALRRHLGEALPFELRPVLDLSIKDRLRLIRLPNTRHESSGLYKTWLSYEELMTCTPEMIRELAGVPRPILGADPAGLLSKIHVAPNEAASRLYQRILRQIRALTRKPFEYRFKAPTDSSKQTFSCRAMEAIWEGPISPGYRNNCAIRLASSLRRQGFSKEQTLQKLIEWNEKGPAGISSHEITRVAASAYQHPFPYRYGCRDEILRHFCPLENFQACQSYPHRMISEERENKEEERKAA